MKRIAVTVAPFAFLMPAAMPVQAADGLRGKFQRYPNTFLACALKMDEPLPGEVNP